MRGDHVLVHARERREVAHARRELRRDVTEHGHDVGFVDRAAHGDQVAERGGRALAEPGEVIDDRRLCPPTLRREPPRVREVVERDDRHHVMFETAREHPPVMVERVLRPLVRFGFDARPLERESVGAEPEVAQQSDVVKPG